MWSSATLKKLWRATSNYDIDMKLQKDPFDTSILGQEVYKMTLTAATTVSELNSAIAKIKQGIVHSFIPVLPDKIHIMEKLQFHFVGIRNTYLYVGELSKVNSPLGSGYTINYFKSTDTIQKQDLDNLATPIYKMSRYYKDETIPKAKSKAVYIQWIKNSLYNGYADQSVLAWYKNKPVGICTLRIKNKDGYIDLLGVVPQHQNQHIGKLLLHRALSYMKLHKINNIFVVTEGENIPANIFYQKNNFLLHSVVLVYHKNLNKKN